MSSFPHLSTQVLLDAMPHAVVVVSSKGHIVLTNSETEALLGYRREELEGRSLDILLPDSARSIHGQHLASYFATPRVRAMGAGLELMARSKDGTEIPVEITLNVLHGEEGPLTIACIRDDTQRRQLMASARLSEEKYRHLVENASEIFYRVLLTSVPGQGRVEFVSSQCEAVTGHSAEEFLENPSLWVESIHPEDLPALFQSTETILSTRTPGTRTYRIRCSRRNEYRCVEDRVTPLLDSNGNVVAYQGVARDVTEARRLEEEREKLESDLRQAQKMEAVGRLAGGIAHDFNNYLTLILGNCELLLSDLDPGTAVSRGLKQIADAGKRSAQLTRQLLAFARQQIITPKVLDLNASIRSLEPLLRRTIGETVRIQLYLGDGLHPVLLDASQVDQLVMNLAINARDAMADGGTLTLATRNTTIDQSFCDSHPGARPGEYAVIVIKDTGRGMDEATRKHAFEPFFTTKPEGNGTGLGLATIYGIVKQNSGFIDLQSALFEGTTVRIYIPRCAFDEPLAATSQELSIKSGRETILLVEDDAGLRELTQVILQRLGYRVLEANDPTHAMAMSASHEEDIHLLLTDVVMPLINGADLSKRIAEARPRIRTVFMSGYSHDTISKHGVLNSGVQLLQKPFEMESLARIIRNTLDRG